MKKIFVLLLLSCSCNVFSQDWPVKKMVTAKRQSNAQFLALPVFSFVSNKTLAQRGTYQQLKLDASFLDKVMQQRPEALQLSIPLSKSKSITCELVQFSLGNIKFTENNDGIINDVRIPVTYRGIVSSEREKNNVMLTVNDDYLSIVVTMADKVMQVTKADETDKATYRLYNSATLQFPVVPIECGNNDNSSASSVNGIEINGVRGSSPTAVQDKCINVFVDCFDSLFQNQANSRQKTIDFVYELFNSVGTGYYNDSINVQITTINVWTNADPYRGDTRENALADLATFHKDNFWGNICVGLDFSTITNGRSGVADDIGRIKAVSTNTCPAYDYGGENKVSACCYNDMGFCAGWLLCKSDC